MHRISESIVDACRTRRTVKSYNTPSELQGPCACAWRCCFHFRTPVPVSTRLAATWDVVAPSAGPDKQHTQPTTSLLLVSRPIFTARRYASAVHAMALCFYPCLSVTSRFSAKMTQRRCTITVPHNRSGTLMPEISRSSTAGYGGAKCRCGGLKSATFDK